CSRSVATFASDSRIGKRRRWVVVFCSWKWRPHPANVAMPTTGKSRQIHWHFSGVAKRRRHVPALPVGVPIHWRLEKKSIHSKQITSPTPPGADVIEQLAIATHSWVVRTLETEPHFSLIGVNAIVHSGFLMYKISRKKIADREPAGLRHGSFFVGIVDGRMTGRAGLISRESLRIGIRCAGLCLRQRSDRSPQKRTQPESKEMAHLIPVHHISGWPSH